MTVDRNARIQQRAYHLWLEAGRLHGLDREHWYRAEREVAEHEVAEHEVIEAPDTAAAGAITKPATSSRSRAKSPAATPADPRPRTARSRSAAAGSGSRGGRRSAAAKSTD